MTFAAVRATARPGQRGAGPHRPEPGARGDPAFDGNLGVEVRVDEGDRTHWLILESWQSAAHDAAYREFRAGPRGHH